MQPLLLSTLLAAAAAAASVSASTSSKDDQPHMLYKRQDTTAGMSLTGPGPGEVFKSGGLCTVTWSPDTSGSTAWKSWTLDFMTGANQNMVKLGTIATGLDGTDPATTSFSWTCPQVDPYSAIYFYQATADAAGSSSGSSSGSSGSSSGSGSGSSGSSGTRRNHRVHARAPAAGVPNSPQWTTRWAISSASGETVPPPHANQPQPVSPAIPWGAGRLLSTISTVTGSSSGSASGSASGSGSASSNATGANAGVSVPSNVQTAVSPNLNTSRSSASLAPTSSTSTAPSAPTTSSPSSAAAAGAPGGALAASSVGGIVAGTMALVALVL